MLPVSAEMALAMAFFVRLSVCSLWDIGVGLFGVKGLCLIARSPYCFVHSREDILGLLAPIFN